MAAEPPPPPVTVLGRLSLLVLEAEVLLGGAVADDPGGMSLVEAARPLLFFVAPPASLS